MSEAPLEKRLILKSNLFSWPTGNLSKASKHPTDRLHTRARKEVP